MQPADRQMLAKIEQESQTPGACADVIWMMNLLGRPVFVIPVLKHLDTVFYCVLHDIFRPDGRLYFADMSLS